MGCPLEDGRGTELIVAYSAGTLAPETEAEFQRHLESCAKCRRMVEAQGGVWTALDAWPAAEVSPDFDHKVYQRIAAEQQRAWWRRRLPETWSWRPAVPVAAACAVMLTAFLLKSPLLHPAAPSPNEPKVQIEQVEHALDDMDMLKQLSVDSAPDQGHSSEKI